MPDNMPNERVQELAAGDGNPTDGEVRSLAAEALRYRKFVREQQRAQGRHQFITWDDSHWDSDEPSGIVGLFDTEERAQKAADEAEARYRATLGARDNPWEHQFYVLDAFSSESWSKYHAEAAEE